MIQFDYDSILGRLKTNLSNKLSGADILFFSTNQRILEAVAEELAEEMQYDEYLTREAKWSYAQNITSLLAQTDFFNYLAHRRIGSTGTIRVSASSTFSGDHPLTISIPKYTEFSNGETSFSSVRSRILSPGQNYIDIEVIQGIPKIQTFEITNAQFPTGTEYAQLTVENPNIENTLFDIKVNGILWERIDHIRLADDGESKVYVINNIQDFSGITLEFGNDVFGKKLEIGDIVTFNYLETKGETGNILRSSNVNQIIGTFYDATPIEVALYCTNTSYLVGGSSYEDIEEIRSSAPRSYQTGDRAMTRQDYETLILKSGIADRVVVWGETEINEDRGNPPGTYLPLEENLVYITGFNIDPLSLSGSILNENNKTAIRELLNDLKGPTDIIRFEDTQFIYITFNTNIYVSDRRYSLEEVRANIENGLRDHYSLENTTFRENLYFSQYYQYINSVAGVDHHTTTLSFSNIVYFKSAYVFDLDIALNNIKPGTVEIYVRLDTEDDWSLMASDDGNFNLIGEAIDPDDSGSAYYELPGATINYSDGLAGEIIVSFGLTGGYSNYEIRVDFELDDSLDGDLLLTKRQQIYSYYDSNITTIAMDTY